MTTHERIGRLRGPLTITCTACAHRATWTPKEAVAKLGAECTVFEARERLRCSACGGGRFRSVSFS